MTINPSTVGHDTYDLLDGSLSSFYQEVDEAIVASEVVKGQYRLTVNPAYNSPNPVAINNFTTVALSQSGPMVVDLENSFITARAKMTIAIDKELPKPDAKGGLCAFFIGWKSSVEAVNRYDVLVNSTPIYNQSFCGEESFLQYQVLNENVKHTSPYIYTSYDEAKYISPNVCGAYVFFDNSEAKVNAGTEVEVEIPIKIPIPNFVILKNIKYLLSWMGKWELRLYFNYENMVIMPIPPDVITASGLGTGHTVYDVKDPQFTQISQTFKFPCEEKGKEGDEHITVTKMTFEDVEMVSAQFQLRMDICEMLKQKYLGGKPLTFPVSTFQIAKFTMPAGNGTTIADGSQSELNCVLCQAINNCDTLFIIPVMNGSEHTVCYNPHITNFQLHAGEYGTYPTQPFDTYDPAGPSTRLIRYVNIISDSLNVNSSDLTSFNSDAWGAHHYQINTVNLEAAALKNYVGPNGKSFDKSNFFVGIPFSTDDDFQGGLSSPSSNINFKITGQLHNTTGSEIVFNTPWTAAFLIDGVLMIRPDPGSDAAKVIWSDRTVV